MTYSETVVPICILFGCQALLKDLFHFYSQYVAIWSMNRTIAKGFGKPEEGERRKMGQEFSPQREGKLSVDW